MNELFILNNLSAFLQRIRNDLLRQNDHIRSHGVPTSRVASPERPQWV